MPSVKNNVYIDSTFTSADEGYIAVDSSVEFVDPSDNIGNYSIPIIYQTTTPLITSIDVDVEYLAEYTTISGTDSILVSFFSGQVDNFGVVPSLVEYSVESVTSGTLDSHIDYFTGYNPISGTINEKITFIAGERYNEYESYVVEYEFDSSISGSKAYWLNYTNFCGSVNPSGLPIPSLEYYDDTIVEYGTGDWNDGGIGSYIDITFAGWATFPFPADIFSVDMNVSSAYPFDVETISGTITPHYLDIYSVQLTTSGIEIDVYCALVDMATLLMEAETIKGRVGYLTQEVYSTAAGSPGITCDIDLYPLKITNFSLDVSEYTVATDYISVDILDDIYGVTISGTYFMIDGEEVSVTFSGIENGYRMFYDPVDDFNSLNGPTVFTAHAENSNGDTLEEDYYLTFGYLVEYVNCPRIGQDYGYNTKVTVRITAENYASCPKLGSDGHRFITEQRKNVDLGASIVGMFHADDVSDLSAEIYPSSTAYFYGKTFEVVIEAKDFAGNITPSFVLTYRIEDKPS